MREHSYLPKLAGQETHVYGATKFTKALEGCLESESVENYWTMH